MKRHVGPAGQSWWTFLRNHMPEIAAMDLFLVPALARSLNAEMIQLGHHHGPEADLTTDSALQCRFR
jgi:hypothetical protein